jgi:uncharacterized protein (TIGR02246 family)
VINLRMLTIIALTIGVAGGCSATYKSSLSEEETAIRRTDADWLAAAESHSVNSAIPFWADDATIMAPGMQPVVGKDAIRKYVTDSFAIPGFSISWKTDKIEVSQSDDLAYSTGTNQISFNGPDGKVVTQNGNSAAVWKKESDGSWKCIVDIMTPGPDESPK